MARTEDEFKPGRYRQQHHPLRGIPRITPDGYTFCDIPPPVMRQGAQEPDADGNIGSPYRVRDTVQALLDRGDIDDAAEKAARRFQWAFDQAHLNGYQSPDLARVLGSGSGRRAEPARILDAKDDVWRAIRYMGGIGTPISQAAWHVLGLGDTIEKFAGGCQLGHGRTLNTQVAKGLVVGCCGVLSGHYGS